MKTGTVDANASANAMVAGMRFEYGVPHYRLAKIQERRGMALPAANQDRMIKQVAFSAAPVHEVLVRMAADGELLQSDDTKMKILNCLKNGQDPPIKRTQTTVIISHVKGRAITLHVTGPSQAGANVSAILASRSEDLEPPIHMCDGLNANNLTEDAIVANCLDHARRKFYDLRTSYKDEVNYILSELQKVYLVDRKAKELPANERLAMHRRLSKPTMDSVHQWMQDQFEERKVEPNSPLGKAINYSLKRWPELTRFLEIPIRSRPSSGPSVIVKTLCFTDLRMVQGTATLSNPLSKPAIVPTSIASIISSRFRRTARGFMRTLRCGCRGTIGPISDFYSLRKAHL
jgi:hypothetical protein